MNKMTQPKIFCFINDRTLPRLMVVALAEDGELLAIYGANSEIFAKAGIGFDGENIISKSYLEKYARKYPKGYDLTWIADVFDCLDVNNEAFWEAICKAQERGILKKFSE
jgi:hypothetical protein